MKNDDYFYERNPDLFFAKEVQLFRRAHDYLLDNSHSDGAEVYSMLYSAKFKELDQFLTEKGYGILRDKKEERKD